MKEINWKRRKWEEDERVSKERVKEGKGCFVHKFVLIKISAGSDYFSF